MPISKETCAYSDCDNNTPLTGVWHVPYISAPAIPERGIDEIVWRLDVRICNDCAMGKSRFSVLGPESMEKLRAFVENTNSQLPYNKRRDLPRSADEFAVEFRLGPLETIVTRHNEALLDDKARVH